MLRLFIGIQKSYLVPCAFLKTKAQHKTIFTVVFLTIALKEKINLFEIDRMNFSSKALSVFTLFVGSD